MSLDQTPVDSPTAWVADHIRRYVATDGQDGHLFHGIPTLLLTTLGRKSGQPRRLALIYGRHGDDYVVVASNGGAQKHPEWYSNLVAHPEVKVQVLGEHFHAQARDATPDERAILWPRMVELFPNYAVYQTKTARQIPVVVLARS